MREYKMRRTALIDADFIAYQLAAWAHSHQADVLEMTERIDQTFNEWMTCACCTDCLICFSCDREDNFRRDHYPLYKTNRSDTVAPAMLPKAKEVLSGYGRVVTIPRLEADDVMGILATNGKIANSVIITVDKDLRGVPGWHFNPDKEDFPVHVTELQADYTFFTQWLTGDSTDNFGGIKGVGPAKAKKLLNQGTPTEWVEELTHEDEWAYNVLDAYRSAGYTLEEALSQARCARILRAEDFDAEARAARPYNPPVEAAEAIDWEGVEA